MCSRRCAARAPPSRVPIRGAMEGGLGVRPLLGSRRAFVDGTGRFDSPAPVPSRIGFLPRTLDFVMVGLGFFLMSFLNFSDF